MRRKVRISGPAGRDLSGIFGYVSGESPQAAERLANMLDAAIQDLDRFTLKLTLGIPVSGEM
jgi:plasmid stabilization system protein ParE